MTYEEIMAELNEKYPNRLVFSIHEAAEMLGVSVRTFTRNKEKLKIKRIGGKLFITKKSIARFMSDGEKN